MKDTKHGKVRDHCYYKEEYRGAAHSICNLKHSVPKKFSIAFLNGSHFDYHFIIKESAEEFKKQFTSLGEKTEKGKTFTVPIKKEITRTDKDGEKITKIDLTYYSLLIAQDLWQTHYQILSISCLKEFIELNVNTDMMTKKCETCGIKYKHCDCFLEYMKFKDDLIE